MPKHSYKLLKNLFFMALPLIAVVAQSTLLATMNLSVENQIKTIDREIADLNKQLEVYRLRQMRAEIMAQPQMFEEWGQFAKSLQEAEQDELEGEEIQNRIQSLEKQKDELMQQSKASSQ